MTNCARPHSPSRRAARTGVFLLPVILLVFASVYYPPRITEAAITVPVTNQFRYTFNSSGILLESGTLSESSSPYFWLNSGGKVFIENGVGSTVEGSLLANDYWRLLYSITNPLDTANGYYPQNIFRLVTRSLWGNAEERVSFRITKTNLTNTPNRDGWSGVLLFSRYKDGDNLYYAGLRHDGSAVIKKKVNGTYYTLAQKSFFGNPLSYNKYTNPNLIPGNKWMGIKMKTTNRSNGSVSIELLLDKENTGVWQPVLSVIDSGVGGRILSENGHGGIRTDYMDVEFDNFELKSI